MASLIRSTNGRKAIQFTSKDGRRPTIRLGKMTEKALAQTHVHVERLVQASIENIAPPPATSAWVAELGDSLHGKLVRAGLVVPREKRDAATLAAFLDGYFDRQTSIKPRTRMKLDTTRRALVAFFGASKRLDDVSEGDARDFRQSFKDRGLRENSIRKHVAIARQFFADARRRRIIDENPFAGLPGGTIAAPDRMAFVTHDMIRKVINVAPCHEWKLIIALARFGGLRTPSETLALKWGDIDWERGRMTVSVPKLAHIPGKEYRVVPIFAELRPFLEDAFELAPEGAVNVIGRYRDGQNLVPHMRRLVRRSGQENWPKAFQNLRSSRQTELEASFPSHTVCQWMGNSQKIAARHYLQVLESDFEKAIGGGPESMRKSMQTVPDMHRFGPTVVNTPEQKPLKNQQNTGDDTCTKLAVVGLEPTTYGL